MGLRSFLALEVPEPLRDAIVDHQRRLAKVLPPLSWVKSPSLHLTLKFFGEIEPSQVEVLREGVAVVLPHHPAFSLQLSGLGIFPPKGPPRTLWVGVTGDRAKLISLVEDLDQKLETLGFAREAKSFNPHLTIARIKSPSRAVSMALEQAHVPSEAPDFGAYQVHSLCLFKSELMPGGSIYTKLWELPLAGC